MRRDAGRPGLRFQLELLESRHTPASIGGLDPSFGTGGAVLTDLGQDDIGHAVTLQPDGKVVVVGSTGSSNFAAVRYNPDGSLDTSFNGTGAVAIDFGGVDVATSVALQPDGRIVIAGTSTTAGPPTPTSGDFAVARLNADGTLDTSFGSGGKTTLDLTGHEAASGVAIQPDGKLIIVGSTSAVGGGAFAVVRLTSNGVLDGSFGPSANGLTTVDFGGGADSASGVALQSDGRVVVVGSAAIGATPSDFAVVRLTTAGQLDTTFNTTGKQTIDFGGNDTAAGVALQSDGRIVIAGTTDLGSADFAIARLNTNGSLDPSFSGDGKQSITFGKVDTASSVSIAPDGRIVVAGTTNATGNGDFAVQRLYTTGNLDTTFGPNGQRTYDLGGVEAAAGVVVNPDGRIVLAGTSGSPGNFATLRVIGTVETGRNLATSGTSNGAANVFTADFTGGIYNINPVATLAPFTGFTGTVRTAVGDVNGDGVEDTVLVTGSGTAIRVAVISGTDNSTLLVPPFDPFGGNFTGGGFVAAADLDNDGRAEIIVTPDQGGGPRVTIFSLLTTGLVTRANFLGIDDANFRGGCRPAAGDVNGDGVADLAVAAGFLGGPRVALFDGRTLFTTPTRLVGDFFAFPGTDAISLRNGAFVAVGDVDGDGRADLIFGGGPGGAPRIFILSGQFVAAGNIQGAYAAPIANFFFAGLTTDRGGVHVAAKDVDGDTKADVVAGSGENVSSRARVYFGDTITSGTTTEPTGFQDLDPYNSAFLSSGVFVG